MALLTDPILTPRANSILTLKRPSPLLKNKFSKLEKIVRKIAIFETSLPPLLAQTLTQGIELLSLSTDTREGLIFEPASGTENWHLFRSIFGSFYCRELFVTKSCCSFERAKRNQKQTPSRTLCSTCLHNHSLTYKARSLRQLWTLLRKITFLCS